MTMPPISSSGRNTRRLAPDRHSNTIKTVATAAMAPRDIVARMLPAITPINPKSSSRLGQVRLDNNVHTVSDSGRIRLAPRLFGSVILPLMANVSLPGIGCAPSGDVHDSPREYA